MYIRCISPKAYSLYYAEACNKFAGPISASLRPGSTALETILLRWQAVGSNVSDLTCPRFEPETYRSKDELVPARPNKCSVGIFYFFVMFVYNNYT